jgi:hypothetical protein
VVTRPNIAAIVQALERHDVEYVVVGGIAAQAYGAQRPTKDFDCLIHRTAENLETWQQPCGTPRLVGSSAFAQCRRTLHGDTSPVIHVRGLSVLPPAPLDPKTESAPDRAAHIQVGHDSECAVRGVAAIAHGPSHGVISFESSRPVVGSESRRLAGWGVRWLLDGQLFSGGRQRVRREIAQWTPEHRVASSLREDRPPSSKRNGQSQLFVEDVGRLLTYGFQVER